MRNGIGVYRRRQGSGNLLGNSFPSPGDSLVPLTAGVRPEHPKG